ncbi:MAG: beta-ketoacyl-ACP synthase II [Prolixibacteraceae bacterium]|jgi:3-oxoacyl-[acyl-carrier-protein] synthase II
MELKRVVVTGLGTINPLGKNVEEYWEGLRNGVSGAGPITRFDASKYKTRFACEIKNFDPNEYLNRKEVQKHDMYAQYAYIAAAQAIENSGLDLSKIDKDEVGVIWGAGIGGLDTFYQSVTDFNSNPENPRFSPFFIPKMIANMASGNIAMQYGFRGPTITTVTACASATHAMIDALTYIRLGKANIFIAGGSEAAITHAGVGGFNAMHALSTRNDDPQTASRPFDKDRDGFVMGEGAGALVLEEYEHAIARGATIWAELVGGGMSTDAYHMTAPDPEGGGAALVMKRALNDAGLQPEDIDYINVHGTSTGLGDIAEPKAIKLVFGEHIYKVSISATKSMTGHLLGAAGAVEAIACILAMKYSMIPPTINQFELDPEIDPNIDFTFNHAKAREVTYALSNTFGFGGHNGTVIFKKFKQ